MYDGDYLSYRGFRNIPGGSLCHVERLRVQELAPGTHLGRLVIWQKQAIEKLPAVYAPKAKSGFPLPHCVMQNAEVNAFLRKRSLSASITAVSQTVHSESIQKELRQQKPNTRWQGSEEKANQAEVH